ncbi:uncharacterized protein [Leptinotarsa decemlineata]|uniref:uncharacterized protein n=1 Tax=Leptinotarsa decemlineata TaxID=7539 RepID=UPI003D30AA70
MVADSLAKPSAHLINTCIKSGTYPQIFKIALVTPIHKKDRLDNILKLFSEFRNLQNDIEMACTLDTLTQQTVERDAFEEKYYELTNKAKIFLSKHDSSSQMIAPSSVKYEWSGIKLPEIVLPKFNGNFEDWLEFRDIFDSLIHKNESLTNIQRFFYLRGALEGTAAASIKNIQYTSDNYSVA